MTITIPTPPTFADLQLPPAPTIDLPTLDTVSILEPVLTDPPNGLRDFIYSRYAKSINSLINSKVEDYLTWSGNSEYFKVVTDKATDKAMLGLLKTQNAILLKSAARGFKFLPGQAVDDFNRVELEAKELVIQAGLETQKELSKNALEFITFASTAGASQIRVGVNENKDIIYANMAAVETIVKSIIETQKNHIQVFNGKAKQYELLLQDLDVEALLAEVEINTFNTEVKKVRLDTIKQQILLDERHAENLGVSINNANTLLSASEALQEAELEKQKVLQTHAVLSKYLAEIKEAHSHLVLNRSEVDATLAEVDQYKAQAQLADQKAKMATANISAANSVLNQKYQTANSEIKRAKAEIAKVEASGRAAKAQSDIANEHYNLTLRKVLLDNEILDLESLSDQKIDTGKWLAELDGRHMVHSANMSKKVSTGRAWRDAKSYSDRVMFKAVSDLEEAIRLSEADTVLKLVQNISEV